MLVQNLRKALIRTSDNVGSKKFGSVKEKKNKA